MQSTTIPYGSLGSLPLEATFTKAPTNRKEQTIIYIHGGGLVYGNRLDLPEAYLRQFIDNGYDFLAIDYPLAPETKLKDIVMCAASGVNWFLQQGAAALDLQSTDFILFGRSSGAYLSLLLTKGHLAKRPKAIICLYGYYSLMNGSLKAANRHYLKFPKFQYTTIKNLIGNEPITAGPIEKRYSLYVYYRQTGKWVYSLLNENDSLENYSLSEEEVRQLPPTFLSASTDDQDVPYQITSTMAKWIPENELYTVHGLEHDYDRNTHLPESQELYKRILDFLGNQTVS